MGGVLDGGVGIDTKESPRRAAIEKAHLELRQEYDVRDERRRELDFLEKGGNPLDFKLGQAASVSVQSTSHTDQHPEQNVTSAAKGKFPSTVSPRHSIESSERPVTVFEPTSADNLLLFDVDNDFYEDGRNSNNLYEDGRNSTRHSNFSSSEKSSHIEGSQNAKHSEDLASFRPYARRNRSRSNREGARSNSTDTIPPRGGPFSSLPARHSFKDPKGLLLDSNNQMDNCPELELNGLQESSAVLTKVAVHEGVLDVTISNGLKEKEQNQLLNVDAPPPTVDMDKMIPSDTISRKDGVVSASFDCSKPHATTRSDNVKSSSQLNETSSLQRERDNIQDELQISGGALKTKKLDSESSCTQTDLSLVRNNESDLCNNTGNADNNVMHMDDMLGSEVIGDLVGEMLVKEDNGTNYANIGFIANDDYDSVNQNKGHGSTVKKEMLSIGLVLQNGSNVSSKMAGLVTSDSTGSDIDREPDNNSEPDMELPSTIRHQDTMGSSICELADASSSGLDPADAPDIQTHNNRLKLLNKAHEDSILEEARTIEAKRKRITELSAHTLPLEQCRKSHWDFVLEEMAWLANDVAQERLWKIAAASTISHQVALNSQSRFEEQKLCREQKKVAFTLSKAVMHFWHSIQELVNNDSPIEASKELDQHNEENRTSVEGYGVRFLKYTKTIVSTQSEAPLTPDRVSDLGIQESLDANEFMEESLVYLVPSGALETYRKTIESCLIQLEKTGSIVMQEEVDTSMHDAVEDLSQGNTYDEDEGETSMYYNPGGIEGAKPSKFSLKKLKKLTRAYNDRSYEPGADFPYEQCTIGSHQPILIRKRPVTNLNVGFIPTKRVRTASRPRVQSPFGAGAIGNLPAPNKTDASSGDTNSFQDDQSTMHSGPRLHKGLEAESAATDFEKPLPYDSGEISAKPRKKKKAKHLNSTYEQRWQLDSIIHNEQRDNMKKRLGRHHLDSNGFSGLIGQHNAKKPKMMKQSLDNTYDNSSPRTGSIPSPVASQMSNMSNTNKFMKLIGGRDRGRKSKNMKISAAQPGSGNPWSLFEDQALVVLVHDMGPNWELVSDAINCTLQFKSIYRKPKECKERHKNLMDRTAGDGADSAEDSGSSQPYPSTLPGIPKGSARQLFQRLQGPMEEDTLKSHFEKIISIGHRQHYLRSQTDNQEMKHIAPIHDSHVLSLSQVCPNNLNGGFLTPLDLCDMSGSSPDVIAHGYQGPQSSGLTIANQGFVAPFSTSGANLSLQGSGGNIPSPSSAITSSNRDVRYVSPRTSLPVDEQQRLQQYNTMISGRSVQQSNFPVSGALSGMDHRARMVSGGNGMGMIGGKNRTMSISRPGFQGIASASMLNNGSMLSSSMAGMPSHGTMHHGASSGQGNSMPRPREAVHIMRPAQNQEHQRQMMLPQQGNSQGVAHLNNLNSNFSNQTASPVTIYPIHSSQHRVSSPQPHVLQNSSHPPVQGPNQNTGTRHPPYAQLKERQLQQQRLMHQRHQQYHLNASSALTPHVQPQFQPPVSPSTSQQVSHPSSTPSPPVTPMSSQLQQKQNLLPHGMGRSPQITVGGLNNQMGKQRQIQAQKQQFEQTGRQHPQIRQQPHSQQQAKHLKGMGRGNLLINQNLSIDPSQSNGISTTPVSQAGEKGEQVRQLMQGQGIYSESVQSSVQPPHSDMSLQASNQSQLQQKLSSATSPPFSKQFHQMPSHSDNNSSQGHTPPASSGSQGQDSHQAARPSFTTPNHHHRQIHPQQPNKHSNQVQINNQKLIHQNYQGSSDFPSNPTAKQLHTDQQLVNNTSHIETPTSKPQFGIDSTNVVPTVFSSGATPWKASEPVYDSSMQSLASPLDSVGGSLPRSNSMQPINLVQRQFSGGLVPQGHKELVEESQQELPQLQGPPHQSQQQMQHLPSG